MAYLCLYHPGISFAKKKAKLINKSLVPLHLFARLIPIIMRNRVASFRNSIQPPTPTSIPPPAPLQNCSAMSFAIAADVRNRGAALSKKGVKLLKNGGATRRTILPRSPKIGVLNGDYIVFFWRINHKFSSNNIAAVRDARVTNLFRISAFRRTAWQSPQRCSKGKYEGRFWR